MRKTLMLLAVALPLQGYTASSFMTDASDLWWNPDESGWGVNVIQQSNVLFATFFVYGSDSRARWYVAPDTRCPGTPADMQMVCSGPLYETAGPVVTSGTFNPSAVTRRQVGTFTFLYSRSNSAIISYTVDGSVTSKTVRRQTWAAVDITGEFHLNRVLRTHMCGGPNRGNEPSISEHGTMSVTQSGGSIQIQVRPVAPATLACTYAGTLSQEGRMSAVEGTFACNDASSGSFSLREIEVSKWGFIGRISTMAAGCNRHGHFGGTRVTVEELPS